MLNPGSEGKIALTLSDDVPLCPWCSAVMTRVRWHKVHGGPAVPYIVALSCDRCHALIDVLAAGATEGA